MYHVRFAAAFRNVASQLADYAASSINFNNGERRGKRAFKLKICRLRRRSGSTFSKDQKCCTFYSSSFSLIMSQEGVKKPKKFGCHVWKPPYIKGRKDRTSCGKAIYSLADLLIQEKRRRSLICIMMS